LLGYVFTITILYITFTPVGNPEILGVQGRYLSPFAPLIVLSVAGISLTNKRFSSKLPALLGALGLATFMTAIYLSYYVPCGYTYYKSGLCEQPIFKNWALGSDYSPSISKEMSISNCRHGYF